MPSLRLTLPFAGVLVALSLSLVTPAAAQNYTCSPSQPCATGCCGQYGICGMGPDFCGPGNCTSTCDAKSECDPGGWGPQYASAESCPLNVCCSQYGFCGTTADFCGTSTVTEPSCSGSSASLRTIGYYEAWSVTRPCDAMYPEDIPAAAYTHLNFAFAYIDPTTFAVSPMNPGDPALYARFTNLKTLNPSLQTWISIGGWSMTDPGQPTATTFSDLAGSDANQQLFFNSLISFLSSYGFDGVDIDWEYPVAPDRSGSPADFQNYVSLLANLRNAFQAAGYNYGLSITLPSSYWYLQNFDLVALEQYVDWFNVMEYDLHGTWDATDIYIGPYVQADTNLTQIDQSLQLLWRNNIDPSKVVLGLGFYGRSFTLSDPSCTATGCEFSGAAPAGPCTQSPGTLSYAEIEQILAQGYTPTLDSAAAVQILVYGGDNWVAYDDATTLQMKKNYADSHCLGGTMVWAVSLDDSKGTLSAALSGMTGGTFVNSVNLIQLSSASSSASIQCGWSNCGASCGAGMSPVAMSAGATATTNAECTGGQVRTFCCPSNNVPTCTWSGKSPYHGDILFTIQYGSMYCYSQCYNGMVPVGSSNEGCYSGYQSLCCENTISTQPLGQCSWVGTPPLCETSYSAAPNCPSGQVSLAWSEIGLGGQGVCTQGYMNLCCENPPPWTGCNWYANSQTVLGGGWQNECSANCPSGMTLLGISSAKCATGSAAFCCNPSTLDAAEAFALMASAWAESPGCDLVQAFSKRATDGNVALHNRQSGSPVTTTGSLATDLVLLAALYVQVAGNTAAITATATSMINYWNNLVAERGLPLLTIPNMATIINNNAGVDPQTTVDELLCDPETAGSALTVDLLTTPYLESRMLYGPPTTTNNCLFYTRRPPNSTPFSLSDIATEYACNHSPALTTIWMLWPTTNPNYYDMVPSGTWLSPIYNQRFTYFENMSRAMALNCRGAVYVMSDDPYNLPTDAIWGTVELPTLRMMAQQGLITSITAISIDGTVQVPVPLTAPNTKRSVVPLPDQTTPLHGRAASCNSGVAAEPSGEDWFG